MVKNQKEKVFFWDVICRLMNYEEEHNGAAHDDPDPDLKDLERRFCDALRFGTRLNLSEWDRFCLSDAVVQVGRLGLLTAEEGEAFFGC